MRADLGAAIVGASLLLATAAQAQSVWGGSASTTTTQNYKLGTNWDPNGAPVAAGQSAIFDTTGKPTINVNAGAIAPDSWTFNANSQSYTITGAAVNFSATGGLFNNANAGQTISIANNLGESAAGAQLQQLGNSTLILTGNNTYSGGTVIAAGTLQIGNGGTSGKISGDVLDLGVLAFNRSNNITFDGLISGNGQVNQIGTGTLILGGANTYSGGTLITNGGTLRANNSTPGVSSSVGTGTVTLDNGQFQAGAANLTFSNNFTINNSFSLGSAFDNNGKTLTLSGIIADGNEDINGRFGSVTFVGSGKTILTGDSTYTGGTTICSCATLQLGTAASPGSIIGAITNEGTFNIVNSNTSGITTITNQSGAFLTFRNSTDAGTMTIDNLSGGSVEFRQGSSAADATINNHISAGTVFTNASAGNATINNIAGFGIGVVEFDKASTAASATINNAGTNYVVFNDQATLEGAKIVNNDAGLVFFNSKSSAGNVAASITNSGQGQVHFLDQSTAGSATITNNDFGVLDFNNHSSADNATIVNNSAIGMAFLNHSTAGNAFITTNNGSATYFFDHSDGGTARFETALGGIVDFSGSSGLNNDGRINAGSIAGAGNYYIGGGNTLVVGGNDRSTEVSGVIADNNPCGCTTGPGALEKVGLGTMILSGDNTYTGGTTITAGTLQLGNGGATGSILGDVVNNDTFAFNRSNTYQFDGVISGSGAIQQDGPGTTTLTAVNTYAGATTISAGVLALSGAGSIANSSGVIDNSIFDISATTAGASIKNLSGAGIVTLGSQTLTLTNAAGTFEGTIGGTGGLIKQGAGLFELSGANTYTGPTTVADGNLRVNGSIASAVNVQSGATLSGIGSIGGLVTIQSGGTLSAGQSPGTMTVGALNLNAGSTSVFELGSPGVVGGPTNDLVNVTGNLTLGGTLSVNAPSAGYYRLFNYGTLTPSNFATVSGSSNGTATVLSNVSNQVNLLIANAGQQIQFWDGADQTGNGVVNGGTGTWNAANTNWTGAPGQATFNDQWRSSVGVFAGTAGTVTIAGAQAFDTLQFITTGYVLNAGAGGQLQLAGLSGTGTINTDNGVNATINAAIVDGSSHSLTKVGGGTLVLTAANTYTGGTTISAGTLQLGNGGTTGSIIGNVLNNGVFAINRSDAFTFAGVISGSGAFNQIGSGTTTLSNTNIYTGPTTVTAGALTISATGSITSNVTNNATFTNAGTVTGSLTNTGTANNSGTITNGLTNTATVNANGGAINGAVANNAGGTFNVGGTVTSDNTFTNAANAVLAIGGSGAYTLQGLLTNSGAVTVASGGQLIATVGGIANNAGGSITVALGGTVKDDLNNAGAITNNGAYAANVTTNSGPGSIINAASWTGNVLSNSAFIANNGGWTGNVALNTGIINNNVTWTGTVSNAGNFNNNAGATVSGLLTNTAGATLNNGALNGGASVSGGIFAGSGTVTNLSVSGGIFAPGNGTPGSSMTVTGNLAFQSGAMYLVALNPTTASLAKVGGTASLNGTAAAFYLAGNYISKKYTILTATGGVNGTFGSLVNTNVPANFTSSLSYDANNAYISLTLNFVPNPTPNFGGGLNINQQNVANTLVNFFNSTGGIPAVFGALTPGGLTQASGELATRTQQTSFDAMNLFLGLLTDPFVAGRGDGAASPAGAPQFAESDDANAYAANGKARSKSEREAYAAVYRKASIRDSYDPRWSVWAAGYGGSQVTDGNAVLGSNNARSSIGGVAVGADYRFSPNTLAGFAVSGGGTGFSVANSGSGRSDLFQAGAFVRHTNGPAYISAALAYGWQDVTTDRTVTGSNLLRANFNANTFSGRAEGGYRFVAPWIGGVGITPYAAGQFTTIDLPAYADQAIAGANTFALTYAAKSVTDTRSELGIRTDKSFAMQNGVFTLRGRAAWAHDFDPDRNIAATFQTLPGASFVVNGAAQARDAALVTGSAEMKWLNGFSLAATFEGEFSSVTRSYAGKGVVRYAW
ncbi:MAG TPA: autotransporter-associated beta strand repeat-containing protein [Bradyrhizobium sp.]|jgi:autotransporter-associated beta strand protein|nr:autotransporter-associated beta strand repeat-containing protein [Bradyrhizobium sp.]